MPDPTFDMISASTLADMKENIVYDEFFVDGAALRKLRSSGALDEYLGGTWMQEPFQYDRVDGGAHFPGANVNVVQKQILAAVAFSPKEYVETVPLNLWQTGVINAGPAGRVKLVDLYMSNAVQAANTDLGIDFYNHGQPIGSGVTTARAQFINGAAEFCNDGVTNSWDGNVFPTIGGQTRNGAIGNVLNSIPIWLGNQDGTTGQAAYKPVLEAYLNCVQPPDIGLTNKAFFAYLLEREEAKQRHGDVSTRDVSVGLDGIKYMNAFIHVDKLCPSTKYGQILPSGLSQTTAIQPSTFTSAATPSSISNLPAATSINPGEVFFWLRMAGWRIRPTADEEYNFNFTPPVRAQNNPDLVVMFFKLGINTYTPSPRDNVQMYGAGF